MVKKTKIPTLDENHKASYRKILVEIVLIVFILSVLALFVNLFSKTNVKPEVTKVELNASASDFFSANNMTRISLYLPAVDNNGTGVVTLLKVEASKGSGRTLTDIDSLLFWADTQQSIRMRRRVAENITGKKTSDYDLVYTINANASIIGGPSAGAALTIATIAALEGKSLNNKVMITGTINHDGTIGPVSSILEKAKSAKSKGATTLIVPLLESTDVIYETKEHCEKFGTTDVCTEETTPKKINVAQQSGIKIIEAASIKDALKYFFGNETGNILTNSTNNTRAIFN